MGCLVKLMVGFDTVTKSIANLFTKQKRGHFYAILLLGQPKYYRSFNNIIAS